jgi:hypothetical protein
MPHGMLRPAATAAAVVAVIAVVLVVVITPSHHHPASVASGGCTKQQARLASSGSALGADMRRMGGESEARYDRDPRNDKLWSIGSGPGPGLVCADLGNGQQDMVVEFQCCTAHTPTPLGVFRRVEDHWRLAYVYTGEPPIYGLRLEGHELIETRPTLRPDDPLCCATGKPQHWALRWIDGRFAAHRIN